MRTAPDPVPVAAPAGLPPFRAIPDLIRENASARPGQLALRQGAHRMAWGELDALVDRVAATLQRHGVRPRESIALCGLNAIAYVALFLGGLRAGCAVAPLPTGTTPEQLAGMVGDCGARWFFTDATVPAFQGGPQRIRMDLADGADSLAGWLLPPGTRPAPVAIQPDWPFNII